MTSPTKSSFVLGHRHLLGIEGLSASDITGLLDLAEEYVELNRQVDKKRTSLRGRSKLLAHLADHPTPRPPAEVEVRDGQVYRWTR